MNHKQKESVDISHLPSSTEAPCGWTKVEAVGWRTLMTKNTHDHPKVVLPVSHLQCSFPSIHGPTGFVHKILLGLAASFLDITEAAWGRGRQEKSPFLTALEIQVHMIQINDMYLRLRHFHPFSGVVY